MSVPGSHTSEAIFEILRDICEALAGDRWNKKLLSAATDCATNMFGRYQGAIILLEHISAPGFFRIWCMADLIDLFVQTPMKEVMMVAFYQPMISLIDYLRRQASIGCRVACDME